MTTWQKENAAWRDFHWWWDEECWEDLTAFLRKERDGIPPNAEKRVACWPGINKDGLWVVWFCWRWRTGNGPWHDTEGFNMSHPCPPAC